MYTASPALVFGDFHATGMLFAPGFFQLQSSHCLWLQLSSWILQYLLFSLANLYTHSTDMLLVTQLYDIILLIYILKG